jgi:hypothetical protein
VGSTVVSGGSSVLSQASSGATSVAAAAPTGISFEGALLGAGLAVVALL